MQTLAPYLVLIGLLTGVSAQIYILIQSFRYALSQGLLCLLFPGYILLYAMRRETKETKALLCWAVGLIAFIVGLIAS